MEHDINLNIHYSAPDEVWKKIQLVYESMDFYCTASDSPCWKGEGVDLWASVEPSGIQIAGTMPEAVWKEWYSELKRKLTEVLGYEIGEPEEGYEFQYDWN